MTKKKAFMTLISWFMNICLQSPVALQVSGLKGSTLTYLSLEPVASSCPHGLQATQYIEPLWCLFLLKRITGGLLVPEPLKKKQQNNSVSTERFWFSELTEQFTQKGKLCHHLLALMLFQNCTTDLFKISSLCSKEETNSYRLRISK